MSSLKLDRWLAANGTPKGQVVQVKQALLTDRYNTTMSTGDPHLLYQYEYGYDYGHINNVATGDESMAGKVRPQGWWLVPDFTVSIEPLLPNSKMLIMCDLTCGTSYWEMQAILLRNGVPLVTGSPDDSRVGCTMSDNNYEWSSTAQYSQYSTYKMILNLLDDPYTDQTGGTAFNTDVYDDAGSAGGFGTTGTLHYNVILNPHQSNSLSVNSAYYENNDSNYWGSPISTLTVMEIAQ